MDEEGDMTAPYLDTSLREGVNLKSEERVNFVP